MGLSFFDVFTRSLIVILPIGAFVILFDRRVIAFLAPGINLSNIEEWLEVRFYFYISDRLNHFV